MGNHNTVVVDLFAGRNAQRRLRNLFASLGDIYDDYTIRGGRLAFILFAPGAALDPALLRSLTVTLTVARTGATHTARIERIHRHDPTRDIYWLVTEPLDPWIADRKNVAGEFRVELSSSSGGHCFAATNIPLRSRTYG